MRCLSPSSPWDLASRATRTTWGPTGPTEHQSCVSWERWSLKTLGHFWLSHLAWVLSCVRVTGRWCWSGGATGWQRQGGSWTYPEVTQSQRWRKENWGSLIWLMGFIPLPRSSGGVRATRSCGVWGADQSGHDGAESSRLWAVLISVCRDQGWGGFQPAF